MTFDKSSPRPTYQRLMLSAGKLVTLPDDASEPHQLVRVSHPMLLGSLVVSAYAVPGGPRCWIDAIAAAAEHSVYGLRMRALSIDEAIVIPDRSAPCTLPAFYFPDADDHCWTWTSSSDPAAGAKAAYRVALGHGGHCDSGLQSWRHHVRTTYVGNDL